MWDRKVLAKAGPFHGRLEETLCDYLDVKRLALSANDTRGVVTALQTLRITGDVTGRQRRNAK